MPAATIFYSWQSDLPNSVNRGFIEDCLDRAIKALKSIDDLKLDPCLDRDTSNVPGSPDIAATIFEKIRATSVFVADVSFIDDSAEGRRTPNPNVLIELGYAASCLGWDRVVCVFNRSFGPVDALPFDLRQRRVRTYELAEGQEKSEERKALVRCLERDIHSILHAPDREAEESHGALLSDMASELIRVIIFGEEAECRMINPWLDDVQRRFQRSADRLRELACADTAISNSMDRELDELADVLDSVAHFRIYGGSWPRYSSLVNQAVERVKQIKAARIDSAPLSEDSLAEVRSMLKATYRKLEKLAARAEKLIDQGRFDETQGEASDLGMNLLQMSHYSIDTIHPTLRDRLREIGRDLHLVETMRTCADGGQSAKAIVDRIRADYHALSELVSLL